MLEIKGAARTFYAGTSDERHALAGIDLTLNEGDFCVVIGSNGAGKSSLLNAVAGKLKLDHGSILIDGQDVTRLPVHRRARFISRVFQDPMLGTAPTMTVAENMLLADLRGRTPRLVPGLTAERQAVYRDRLVILNLGLEDRLDAPVGLLSGGQRQSLSLIMAVSNKPRLLLLDEHTAALDPKTAATVMDATIRAIAEFGLTVLMVTHNMSHALECGNRLIMMDSGHFQLQVATPEKDTLTVPDLIERFHVKSDRMLLQA
jgi:putative ABC transport system ATP-binding protein